MEIARLRERLERDHWPRLQMSLIVLLTGAVGFLASFALLQAGLHGMALRYPLAACAAYAAFLLLLWTWARSRGRALDNIDLPDFGGPGGGPSSAGWNGGGGHSGGGGAHAGFDAPAPAPSSLPLPRSADADADNGSGFSLLDGADDFGWVLIAIAIALGAVLAAGWVVWIAPGLMAELLLDVALAGGLYRRLRRIESQHWLSTALRRTALPFLLLALLAAAAGFAGARYAPGAQSVGDVFAAQRADRS
ncbi:hypothetical protein SAMN04487939_101133 [Lysobacter sp. yr284]|uniref:hypothetical protein n=1 Tax=Lysobacter sp. yr284 TaxID=1761791 RepID=UPI00089435C9|nr:hypothetical protein [Lysobacter sp. yr284]SDY18592.1 hypothetical protein SAMN04487939_101133 [Lysobacter sp. yr284]